MRRLLIPIAFVVVLLAPIVLRQVALRRHAEPAVPSDALPLVILTPHGEPIRREFEEAFSRWHQKTYGKAVDINFLNFGANDGVKILQSKAESFKSTGTYDIDLTWGGGNTTFDMQFKPFLEPLEIDATLLKAAYPNPTIAGLPLYEQSTNVDGDGKITAATNPTTMPDLHKVPLWYGTALGSFGISYNRDVFKTLRLPEPKTWADLANPKLRGWIVLADPSKSSSANQAFMAIVERAMQDEADKLAPADAKDKAKLKTAYDVGWAHGMGLIRQIAANARSINDSASALPSIIASGDVAAGMTIDFFARSQIQFVGDARMGYVEPVNATVVNPDPIAMLRGAPNRETAKHFVEFLLTPEAQKLWNGKVGTPGGPSQSALRRLPVRRDLYADLSNFADPVNPFEAAESFNTSPARSGTFGVLGVLVQASCVGPLDQLRDIAKTDAGRAAIGNFPFGQDEALKRLAAWRAATPYQKVLLNRQWSDEFCAEYAKLLGENH